MAQSMELLGYFSIDEETLKYLKFSESEQHTISLVNILKNKGLWADNNISFTKTLNLDLSKVVQAFLALSVLKIKFCYLMS